MTSPTAYVAHNRSPPSSPYAYARYYDLCGEHGTLDSSLLPARPPPGHSFINWPEAVDEEHSVREYITSALEVDWHTPPGCVEYLSTITNEPSHHEHAIGELEYLKMAGLKLDMPALYHDHDLHMQKLIVRNTYTMTVAELAASLTDAGIGTSSDLRECFAAFDIEARSQVSQQQFPVPRQVMMYLAKVMNVDTGTSLSNEISWETSVLGKTDIPELLQSPSPALSPATLTELIGKDLAPTPASTDDLWTQELEQEVLAMLDKSFQPASSEVLCPESRAVDCTASLLHFQPSRAAEACLQDLLITSPLLPDESWVHGVDSTIHGCELQAMLSLVPSSSGRGCVASSVSQADDMDRLQHLLEPGKMDIDHILAAEQLIEIETTLKVPLPNLEDESSLHVPQMYFAASMLTSLALVAEHDRHWKGLGNLERTLCWTPFSREDFHIEWPTRLPLEIFWDCNDASHGQITKATSVEISRGCLTFDLCNDEYTQPLPTSDGEACEPANPHAVLETSHGPIFPGSSTVDRLEDARYQNIASRNAFDVPSLRKLVQKRKLGMEAADMVSDDNQVPTAKKQSTQGLGTAHNDRSLQNSLLGGTLGHYMFANAILPSALPHQATPDHREITDNSDAKGDHNESSCVARTLPTPCLNDSNGIIQIVVSTKAMARRPLISLIREHLPAVAIVEREQCLTLADSAHQHQEADLTISASQGIILTTMQKLRQRPLPGQVDRNSVKQSIELAEVLYQELYVLVSEGICRPENKSAMVFQPLEDRDIAALADLNAWSTVIGACVAIIYIPGGENELAAWICGLISKTAMSLDCRLAEDESLWERCLRIGGLNAFAAQMMLARLRESSAVKALHHRDNNHESLVVSHSGFAELAATARPSRTALLQDILADSVIGKLNALFEDPWFSCKALHSLL